MSHLRIINLAWGVSKLHEKKSISKEHRETHAYTHQHLNFKLNIQVYQFYTIKLLQ